MSNSADNTSVRVLPPHPSLEFERKRAKKLLSHIHRGDEDAIVRVRLHAPRAAEHPEECKLATAQLVIAREYGFRSWPQLVDFITALHRQVRSQRQVQYPIEHYERQAKTLLNRHANRRVGAARMLAAFIPRFIGCSDEEIFDAEVSLEEAKYVTAREQRYCSWEELAAEAPKPDERDPWEEYGSPLRKASKAIRAEDLGALKAVVAAHPDVLARGTSGQAPYPILQTALWHEQSTHSAEARRITDWLDAQTGGLQETLNRRLLAGHATVEQVSCLLERGADPNWMPPNGITVLEHAIYRYWNGDAVDLIAARVKPPQSFWVAAGIGDVRALDRYIDRRGKPNGNARRSRPDFVAIGPHAFPAAADASDAEIVWEAFFVAALNDRFGVLDVLIERGFPIDYTLLGATMLEFAVGNIRLPLVEYLVSKGAQVGPRARETAENIFAGNPTRADDARQVVVACGGDPERVLREIREGPPLPAQRSEKLAHFLAAVQKDPTLTAGASEIDPSDLLFAMLRVKGYAGIVLSLMNESGADIEKLRAEMERRAGRQNSTRPLGEPVVFTERAQHALAVAERVAQERRREQVAVFHLLGALIMDWSIADIIIDAGGDMKTVRKLCADLL